MITVSYSGVHQAYQLALAAQEADLLDQFFCSFYDAPGKWGGRLSRLVGAETLKNRRLEGLDPLRLREYPWPELLFKLRCRLGPLPGSAWIEVAHKFDRWAAGKLRLSSSQVVVCSENCAHDSFQTATALGMKRIYDCPGHNAKLWRESTEEAARLTGLPFVSEADTPNITRRKEVEIDLADVVLTYSDFHTEGVISRGVPREHIAQIPLWTDADFWCPTTESRQSSGPLKVLFVGGINLRKGVPFLVEAVRCLEPHATLTLVGSLDVDAKACLAGKESFATVMAPMNKEALRKIYRAHDVLVLPSLGDSFGFVALEAMACGLPVILTTHCGAPLPDQNWRVPVMDSQAIVERLSAYLDMPNLCLSNGIIARSFAEDYTPLRYRQAIGKIFRKIMKSEN